MHGDIFKNGSRSSITFKMELFSTVGNSRAYNQWTVVFACCCGNSTIFTGKIKIGWKCSSFEGSIRHDFLFCRHVFTFFRMLHWHSVSFWKLITKMKTGITVDFIFWSFIIRSNHQNMFWKMLLIKCRKNICRGVPF